MDSSVDKFYLAWRLETNRKGEVENLDEQIGYAVSRFKKRFHTSPAEILVGPVYIYSNSQVLVPKGFLYLAFPEEKTKSSPKGYQRALSN